VVTSAAYAVCLRIAREHYENFPVASRLLPRAMRPHIAAVYAFARIADDFADEGSRPAPERLAMLDDWGSRLRASGSTRADRGTGDTADAVFVALGDTIQRCGLRVELFDDLLSAFRQDVLVKRYRTWDDVLDYCRRSANPVGRLVLNIAGYRSGDLEASSDAVCTALQLTNFWQDFARDWADGRLYVPADIAATHGATEEQLARGGISVEWQRALADVASRTRDLFDRGRAVADGVHGRLRWELRATWLGGVRILERIENGGFDVFQDRPALGWGDAGAIAWRAWRWPRSTGRP